MDCTRTAVGSTQFDFAELDKSITSIISVQASPNRIDVVPIDHAHPAKNFLFGTLFYDVNPFVRHNTENGTTVKVNAWLQYFTTNDAGFFPNNTASMSINLIAICE